MHYNADGTYASRSHLAALLKDLEGRLAEAERSLESHRLALWALTVALRDKEAKDGTNGSKH
jgi:hypothetical protein